MFIALLPVFIIIFLGYGCKQIGFPGDGFWGAAERMTYFVFFPALLINKLAFASFAASTALPMAASIMATILTLSAGLLLLRPREIWPGPVFSSIFQGSIRFNTFVGLAAVSALLGPSGVTLAAVAIIAMIPLINLLCVPTVAYFGHGSSGGLVRMVTEILRNPLILACLVGFALNIVDMPKPAGLFQVFDLLGRAALPVGLLAVGAGLRITSLHTNVSGLLASSFIKLILFPMITAFFCFLFQVTGEAKTVAVLFASLPTAVSAFILARQLGGDTTLMASIVTVHTVLAVATMPLVLALLG
ncbi:MAG: AEC family transporter [Desulfovermiculus sp.]|nr:AEC family transporter [Desulfovermiculus sp.]